MAEEDFYQAILCTIEGDRVLIPSFTIPPTCELCGGPHQATPLTLKGGLSAMECPNVVKPCQEFYEQGEAFWKD